MLETKDSAIKLFGKTIPIKEILVGLSPLSSIDVVDHSIHHHNHDSSTNSSTESHNTIDEKEQEIHKV